MGWNWRKRFTFGPVRINLSKKGLGYSLGARGFRMGQDAQGKGYTHTSIPGTGIYRRDYSKTQSALRKWSLPLLIAIIVILLVVKLFLR
jgi:hypothetical protein